jgi:hypothetical protein
MAEAVPLVQVCIKEMITDGVGTLWNSIQATKKHRIMYCPIEIGKLIFLEM